MGRKRPWDDCNEISKHLLPFGTKVVRRNSTGSVEIETRRGPSLPLRSLSVTLPPVSSDFNRSSGITSSDLLTTVESRNALRNKENCTNGSFQLFQREPVITYPKYIPSYALSSEKYAPLQLPEEESSDITSKDSKTPIIMLLTLKRV